MPDHQNPIKITIDLTPAQQAKLRAIASNQAISMAAVIRAAIDVYTSDAAVTNEEKIWMELVSSLVKQSAAEAQQIRKKLEKTFEDLSRKRSQL